jgi:chaperonin GroES
MVFNLKLNINRDYTHFCEFSREKTVAKAKKKSASKVTTKKPVIKKVAKKTVAKKLAKKPVKKTVKKAVKKTAKKASKAPVKKKQAPVKLAKKTVKKIAKKAIAKPAAKLAPQPKKVLAELSASILKALSPLDDRVVLQVIEADRVTAGGLYIPNSVSDVSGNLKGKVIAAGRGHMNKKGHVKHMDLQIGDLVVFSEDSGVKYTHQGIDLLVIRESEVLGVIVK